MIEVVKVSYIEEDKVEAELANRVYEIVDALGKICLRTPLGSDEYSNNGPTPVVDFEDGRILEGGPAVRRAIDDGSLFEPVS